MKVSIKFAQGIYRRKYVQRRPKLMTKMFLCSPVSLYLLTFALKSSTKPMNSTQSIFDLAIKKNHKSIQSHHLNILGYISSNLSMKCYVLAFSHIWPCRKKIQINQRSLYQVPDSTHQVSRPLVDWFQRRKCWKAFTFYCHGIYVGHVTSTIWTNICFLCPKRLYIKFG